MVKRAIAERVALAESEPWVTPKVLYKILRNWAAKGTRVAECDHFIVIECARITLASPFG